MERAQPFVPRPDVFRMVARGFDWIEYTAPVEVRENVAEGLQQLVDAAKEGSEVPIYLGAPRAPGEGWQRQMRLDALPFVALPKSSRFYKWGLSNEELGITLWFTDSPHRPGVKVEIRSHALWHFGALEAYKLTRRAVSEVCKVGDGWPARPARIDFAADIQGVHFDPSNAADVVSRAHSREKNTDKEALCALCNGELRDDDRQCGRCGAPRRALFEGYRQVGGIATPGAKPPTEEHSARTRRRQLRLMGNAAAVVNRVWTVVSSARCPLRPATVPAVVHRRQHGGFGGKKFTGWEFGAGSPMKVNVYLKTEEIRTKSPDKVWFFRTWEKSGAGYVFSRCPGCGREETHPDIVPATAPRLGNEAPATSKSGLARLVVKMCDYCARQHVIEEVWRVEVRTRGEALTDFAPTGNPNNKITTVDECFKYADEMWRFFVGEPQRRCRRCRQVAEGAAYRHRTCRDCELELGRLEGRELEADELRKRCPYERRRGWFEARDASKSSSGRPTRWPVAEWWQHVQAVHFEGSAPPTAESRRIKSLAAADINRVMSRGCAVSVLATDGRFDAWARENDGKAIALDDFKRLVRDAVLGDDFEWGQLWEKFADKRVRRGLPAPELEELELPAPAPIDPDQPLPLRELDRLDWSGRPPTPAPDNRPARVYPEVTFDLGDIPIGKPKGRGVPF